MRNKEHLAYYSFSFGEALHVARTDIRSKLFEFEVVFARCKVSFEIGMLYIKKKNQV